MIEKGLSMQPRRQTFGAGYALQTVKSYLTLFGQLDDEEQEWMHSVLVSYVEATAGSMDARVQSARTAFAASPSLREGANLSSSPYPVGSLVSLVSQEDLLALSHIRTSVRWFTDEPVHRDVIDTAASTALQAPTACNRVPWKIRIFDDVSSARSVAKIAMGTAGYLHSIQNVAVFVGDQSAYFDERDRHLIYIDASLAAMSFVLSLQAANVSSCCVNWPDIPKREAKMAELLGLAEYERVVMLVVFGYPDEHGLTPFSGKKSLDSCRTYG
ncbi:MAG: nitroreductase family protein [Rhodococcus sp. (in: high G+C Gram-positive bacteria)]